MTCKFDPSFSGPAAALHIGIGDVTRTPLHISMKLWLIDRDDYGYNEHVGFVIRAETEQAARKIASEVGIYNALFLSPERARCVEVTVEGEPGVILDSYSHG